MGGAATAASRGDLGRLAPRKKLLKAGRDHRVSETLQALWHGGFSHFPFALPEVNLHVISHARARPMRKLVPGARGEVTHEGRLFPKM